MAATNDSVNGDLVVLISSDRMGAGDETLGAHLMGSFLTTLGEVDGGLSHLLFVNGGARLVAAGSAVLDQLRSLESDGVELMTCRTCLRHFDLEERVEVGKVGGMPAIVDTLAAAVRTIQV